ALNFLKLLVRQKQAGGRLNRQARDGTCPDKPEEESMSCIEHVGQFHSNRSEIVYVEEAAIVDLFRGDPPEGESVCLVTEQSVESIEAAWIAGSAVDRR